MLVSLLPLRRRICFRLHLFVRQQDYVKTTELISIKLGERMGQGPRRSPLDSDLDQGGGARTFLFFTSFNMNNSWWAINEIRPVEGMISGAAFTLDLRASGRRTPQLLTWTFCVEGDYLEFSACLKAAYEI